MRAATTTFFLFAIGCSCGGSHVRDDAGIDGGRRVDAGFDAPVCVDHDHDGLADDLEGTSFDSDGDGLPSSEDIDSDGDGLLDRDESEPSPTGPCGRTPAFCGCMARSFAADSDFDGRDDREEHDAGTDACDPDENGDGCPDGETCGDALAAVIWTSTSFVARPILVELPAGTGTIASVEARIASDELVPGTFRVVAVESTPASTSTSGATFVGVPAGARLEVHLEPSGSAGPDGPRRATARLQLLDESGAVLTERPVLVVMPQCTEIFI